MLHLKATLTVACFLAIIGIVTPTHAAVNLYTNGILWQSTYEGDVNLDTGGSGYTPAIVHGASGGTLKLPLASEISSDGDLFTFDTSGPSRTTGSGTTSATSSDAAWRPAGSSWDSDTDTTMEVRLKINSDAIDNREVFSVRMAPASGTSSGRTYLLLVGDGWVLLRGTQASTASWYFTGPPANPDLNLDTSVFNTFRVTISNSGPDGAETSTAALYINHNPIPVQTIGAGGNSPGTFKFVFGDDLNEAGGSVTLDYVRWTNLEAVPVPEPSVLLLAGAGLLVLHRRPRNRFPLPIRRS